MEPDRRRSASIRGNTRKQRRVTFWKRKKLWRFAPNPHHQWPIRPSHRERTDLQALRATPPRKRFPAQTTHPSLGSMPHRSCPCDTGPSDEPKAASGRNAPVHSWANAQPLASPMHPGCLEPGLSCPRPGPHTGTPGPRPSGTWPIPAPAHAWLRRRQARADEKSSRNEQTHRHQHLVHGQATGDHAPKMAGSVVLELVGLRKVVGTARQHHGPA